MRIKNYTLGITILAMVLVSGLGAQSGFDADRAFSYLEGQCDLGTRDPNSPGAKRAIAYYQEILEPLADEMDLQSFEHDDP